MATFKLTAATERTALAEITRRANRAGKGWKVAAYDGSVLLATRAPGDTHWHRVKPVLPATAAVVLEAPPRADRFAALEALQADLNRLKATLARVRYERADLEEEHVTLWADRANLRDDRTQMQRDRERLGRENARLARANASLMMAGLRLGAPAASMAP